MDAKQTLEEAAENTKKRYVNETAKAIAYTEFINGAKFILDFMNLDFDTLKKNRQ